MRLFIAIEAPEAWRDAAQQVQRSLPADVRGLLRLVSPELMHLTLRFLGEVPEQNVPALTSALERATPPIEVPLALGTPGTFGPAARTGVAMLRIEGDRRALDALVARVDAAVEEALGTPREERAYNPHLTLGRVGRRATPDERRRVAEALRAAPAPDPAPFVARRVALVRSHLGPGGPRYEVLAEVG